MAARLSSFQRVGAGMAALFYLTSVGYVYFLGDNQGELDPDVTVLMMAHWGLEDGIREGLDEAFRRFEKVKAAQGVRVRVVQTPVPWRGYKQWMMTQLVSGEPADIMSILGGSHIRYQYFEPLSPYVGKPNPFNQGTPLAGMAWRDTFIDGMEGAFDRVYADYFGVGLGFHTFRLHVNVDLVEKATGSRRMPADLSEWLTICRKLKAYGKKIGEPVSPIGVRGFDRKTLGSLFRYYYSQLNGHLNDKFSRFCTGSVNRVDILIGLQNGAIDAERLAAVSDVLRELGQYFVEGFTAVDLEQSKYLFYAGKIGFFPEGTWNSYSLVRNSPFEVAIISVPPVGRKHKYSKYFTGKLTEAGVGVWGGIGITKASKHIGLAVELLQFMTSLEINQMLMDFRKWPSGIKHARFEGIVKAFQPNLEGNLGVEHPFWAISASTSNRQMYETLETIILKNVRPAAPYFLEQWRAHKAAMVEEMEEALVSSVRADREREKQRSQLSLGLLRGDLQPQERERLRLRRTLAYEAFTESVTQRFLNTLHLQAIRKL